MAVTSLKICDASMMSSERAPEELDEVNPRTRPRRPNTTLDSDGVRNERIRSLKNTRRGHIANVNAKVNEVIELLSDERNLQEVKEKLTTSKEAFRTLGEAHRNYAAELVNEEEKTKCMEYFSREEEKFTEICRQVLDWISRVEENLLTVSLQVDSEVNPDDSVSCADVKTSSKASKISRRLSRASSRASHTSSLLLAKAKEAVRVAELQAEQAMLKKRQELEEQKFHLKQEELRLDLEAEIAKTAAKEQAMAAIVTQPPPSMNLKPVKLQREFNRQEEFSPPPRAQSHTALNPLAPEWPQARAAVSVPNVPIASERLFDDQSTLQREQNDLQIQQNRIVEMLAANQNKSRLPQPRVPIFYGNPFEYHTFVRSFESLIESRTSISTEGLYYLEQYTAGDVKELILSCHHLPPDEGYRQACRLMKKKFGDEFRIASAYESKVLNWPPIKPEDGTALSRFSIYLASCRNAMKGSQYSSKFDQPDKIQRLVLKLPYNMRERWRRLVDDILELQKRPVKFDDVITFVDREARIATNPVFGKFSVDTKVVTDARFRKGSRKTVQTPDKLSFSAHVDTTLNSKAGTKSSTTSNDPIETPSLDGIMCPFCNFRHELEVCRSLRRRPYQERIQFLSSKGLCFGCLSREHLAKVCPERKSCKIDGCPKKHPTVLHTQPRERPKEDTAVGSGIGVADGTPQVRNGMPCINNASCSLTGAGFSRTGMAILSVKVRRRGSEKAITIYAFLDNGSSSTFCTEALMRQLDINGPNTKISLTTLEKKDSLVDSFLVHDLEVTNLDENYIVKLPILYRREIPVSKDDILSQEDVDRWPHLDGVYLPTVNAEIGLLIASDVPEALDPLEVKNSQHGGPYTTRTRLGWAVNGPLKRD